jgi:hypothetical protein
VSLTPAGAAAWRETCAKAVPVLRSQDREIGDAEEQARVEDDGTLTIFVRLPDGGEVACNLPAAEWRSVE